MNNSAKDAERLAAVLNEIDQLFGVNGFGVNDFEILAFVFDNCSKFGVDKDAFDAVEVCLPALLCIQYRYIIPVGTPGEYSVVMWNRVTEAWEALSGLAMPAFVYDALMNEEEVAVA